MRRLHPALLACLLHAGAQAQDFDADALRLADETPAVAGQASGWRSFIEAGVGRADGVPGATRRVSLDVAYERTLAAGWSLALADRLDTSWDAGGGRHGINTLKEAYASWRAGPDAMVDIGRVNVRNGVATAYNPTDWFRRGAVRSVVSVDPASLKQNRAGSDMVRAQKLWAGGSVSAVYARDPDRLLVAASQRIGTVTPQFLAYREGSLPPQFGLNLTGLVNDATVAHLEWAGGRDAAQAASHASAWRNRLSAGLTWTTTARLALTGEFHYNGAAASKDEWQRLRGGPLPLYLAYLAQAWAAQELPTRRQLFFHGLWQDALVPRLDIAAMHAADLTDRSRRSWLELRYHAGRADFSLQWQRDGRASLTSSGAMPLRSWQWTIRHYF